MAYYLRDEQMKSTACARCGAPARLFGVELHPIIDRLALYTYVCDQCDHLQIELVAATVHDLKLGPQQGSVLHASGFDDESLRRLGSAFDASWQVVEASGSPLAEDAATREILAKSILIFARRGETNVQRLVEHALASLLGWSGPNFVPAAASSATERPEQLSA
jgi:hypothetical protein